MTESENIICKMFIDDLVSEADKSSNEYKLIIEAINKDTVYDNKFNYGDIVINKWGTRGIVIALRGSNVIVKWENKETHQYEVSEWTMDEIWRKDK